jgi:hypothetical protein
MSRLLIITLSVVLAISLSVAAFADDRTVVVTPVKSTTATTITLGPAGPAQDCQVGNLNAPAIAIGGFIAAPESYKLAFDPGATCSTCPVGMNVTTIHIFLQTAAACDLVMGVDLEEAIYPDDPTCPNPGPVVCTSPLFNVGLPGAGLYDIALPIDCACVPVDRMYLLGVNIQSVSCAVVPDLVTDAGPATACTNWNDYGTGWYDLLAQFPTWPGNLIMFADVDCCTPPVPVEESTWGAIKALYED